MKKDEKIDNIVHNNNNISENNGNYQELIERCYS